MEFFNNFDQNTGGKLQWQIHKMILEFLTHFDQNSVWKCCCLFFDQNSSRNFFFEELCSHLFLPIRKVKKMSSEIFKNSDDSRILMEFFKNFDQNTGEKLQWQIHKLILKHFDQNSTCKSFLKNYDVICFCLVYEMLINFSGKFHQNSSKNQITVEFFWNFDQNTSGKLQWQIQQMT